MSCNAPGGAVRDNTKNDCEENYAKDRSHKTQIEVNAFSTGFQTWWIHWNHRLLLLNPLPLSMPPLVRPFTYICRKFLMDTGDAYVEHTHFFSAKADSRWGLESCLLNLLEKEDMKFDTFGNLTVSGRCQAICYRRHRFRKTITITGTLLNKSFMSCTVAIHVRYNWFRSTFLCRPLKNRQQREKTRLKKKLKSSSKAALESSFESSSKAVITI